jgi:hypothetical protein
MTVSLTPCECLNRRAAAACGGYCGGCESYAAGTCCGCGYQLGQTCRGECEVFLCCVVERGLEHCGLCPDLPCQLYLAHAAPLVVARHYRAALRRAEIGTTAWLEEQT